VFATCSLLFISGCHKEKFSIPIVTSEAPYGITRASAESGGNIVEMGGSSLDAVGICWSESPNPTIANSTTSQSYVNYKFSSSMTGLRYNVTYYVRAYATNQAGTGYGNVFSFTTTADTFAIGQKYQGGYIFYLDATRHHGLIASTHDQAKIAWGNPNIATGATGSEVGTGKTNTALILAALGSGDYAAYYCGNQSIDGYSDWFLPSKDELQLMRTNLSDYSHGDFSSYSRYWSSTESSATNAWLVNFYNGSEDDWNKELHSYYVRAARAF